MKALMRTLLLVTVASLLALAGCGGPKGPVTVKFMSSDADLPAAWVETFNRENTDQITIVRTEPDWAKTIAEAAAGNASDLLNMGQGTDIAYYQPRGILKDLTPYFKKSKVIKMDDIDLLGNREYQYDGKEFGKGPWYGLSKDYNNIGAITYNKEMFAAAGLPMLSETEPITYDELYALAQKLTKKDKSGKVTTWGYDLGSGWWNFLASDMAAMQGLSFYTDATKSVMNNDPAMRDIWKYWARWFVEGLIPNVAEPGPELGGRQLPVRPGRHRAARLLVRRAAAHQPRLRGEVRVGSHPDRREGRRARHRHPRRHRRRDVREDQGPRPGLQGLRVVHGRRVRPGAGQDRLGHPPAEVPHPAAARGERVRQGAQGHRARRRQVLPALAGHALDLQQRLDRSLERTHRIPDQGPDHHGPVRSTSTSSR